MISYTLKPENPHAHLFAVSCTIDAPSATGHGLSLPDWIPGSYMIRDFAKNLLDLRVSGSEGELIALHKRDKSHWQLSPNQHPVTIEYRVYAWDLSVRSAHLDQTHGFFNGTSVFLAVEGHTEQPHQLNLVQSEDARWRVATSLPAVSVDQRGFGLYQCSNYDELIDHPVEMGDFAEVSFIACGVPHQMVFTGQLGQADLARVARDVQKICEQQIRFFGEPAPVKRYVFMTMVVGDGYGGLEHRASTALVASRDDLPQLNDPSTSDAYVSFLGLCSHEYFHTWNVKRIQPKAFVPFDLRREQYTELLWFFEGVTSYYDDRFLLTTGLISPERYLALMAKNLTRVQRGLGRLRQSVAESSFDAWTKFYMQDENAANAIVSYYTKGALVSMGLDLLIRHHSGQKASLDDLMRLIWQDYLAGQRGISQQDIEQKAAALAGRSLSEYFQSAVFGTDELPLAELLANVGVNLSWHAPPAGEELSMQAAKAASGAYFGAHFVAERGFVRVKTVAEGGPAQQGGIAAGDLLVAWEQLSLDPTRLRQRLSHARAGECYTLLGFRRDELMRFEVTLAPMPHYVAQLQLVEPELAKARWWTL